MGDIEGLALKLTAVPARSWEHATTDLRKATRYEVRLGERLIGWVWSRSRESWATSGRIRTRMLGYTRTWGAEAADLTPLTRHAYSRTRAVQELLAYDRA